jgi:predicted RND superfamily exporter protein
VNISSRTKLMKDAERLLDVIREETEGVDPKVQKVADKMKEIMVEKADKISALIELAKLVDEKHYADILKSIKDIHGVYEKSEKKEEYVTVDNHYLDKYTESVEAALMVCCINKLNHKECALIKSSIS